MKIDNLATATSLTLQFLLELGALAALGYWGHSTGQSGAARAALTVIAPTIAAIGWGVFGSPKAPLHLTGMLRLLLEAAFFGSAVIALLVAGGMGLAAIFAGVVAANIALLNTLGHG